MATRVTFGSWALRAVRLALSRTLFLIGVGGVLTNLGTPVSDVRYPGRLRALAVQRTPVGHDGELVGRLTSRRDMAPSSPTPVVELPAFRRVTIRRHHSG
jgi:hypothetical protein